MDKSKMKTFALIGIAGYIAPRHLRAIKETKNDMVVSFDKNDSVGIIDSFFPNSKFFKKFDDFSKYIKNLKYNEQNIDYVVICSPNYLHFSHIKFALENNIDVICEKPLVLSPKELKSLQFYENKYGAKVNSILQLRLHPAILKLKRKVNSTSVKKKFKVNLTYITPRGDWYLKSWKGSVKKSGGVATNIGIHFFDMLHYVFGEIIKIEVYHRDHRTVCGLLIYDRAEVNWFLSIDSTFINKMQKHSKTATYRNIEIEGKDFEFSHGFDDLHLKSYKKILQGKGFGIQENISAIETSFKIRKVPITKSFSYQNPFLKNILIK